MKRYARKSSGVHMRSVIIGPRRAKVVFLARRAVLSKEDYRRRIQGILRGRRAQEVAANCTKSFRKACTLVVKNSGGAGK